MKPEFVHLHCHTEYSLLDGLPHPRQFAEKAVEFGQPAVALTDHGAMFASIQFHDACNQTGVKPIMGMESYLARRTRFDKEGKPDRDSWHLLLLAENMAGYRNLMQLATAAQLEGFYYYPRVDKDLLREHSEGLICTSGCLSAEIPDLLKQGKTDAAREALAWYRDIFGDRFYIELQDHKIPELTQVNHTLVEFAREFNLPLIATNDVHYMQRGDAFAQDILLCIQTNKTVNETDRMKMTSDDYYFKSSEEMAALWNEFPNALQNTLAVAERCNVDLTVKGYHLPVFPVPEGYTTETYLRALCIEGHKRRYPDQSPESMQQIEYELRVIHEMGFDAYFLIVWDLMRFARESDIWYNVRGSAASSIVAYCLGITNLDPLPHHLVFERFLNPGRISMPDIDLDFPDDDRARMIEYTVNKYGNGTVAQIITFGKLLAKAAIRDVGRALDYPLSEVDRVAKLIPVGPNHTIDDTLEKVPEFRELYDTNESLRKLIDTSKLLEGVARHASTHAAGVVVADKPIVEYTPLHRPTRGEIDTGFPITQFSMGDVEHIGLLKIDFLGLATLTIMRNVCEMIEKRYGVHYDLSNIPVEDAKAFELLSRGDVQGVFQVEGAGMRRVLTELRPSSFDHIVATISLYRPGPMNSIPTYIKRMHGEEPVTYDHPSLEPILAETYGVLVYQEQIIRTAMLVCGYTAPEADILRKAVGKKNKEGLLAQQTKFVEGAMQHGSVPQDAAEKLFDDLAEFARYGFNKAHAADYGVLTCQTAFLKAHYPLEYMCALFTNEIGRLDKIASLAAEARRTGITLLQPDIRYSGVAFEIDYEAHGIRFGLSAIKNVGEGPARVIVEAQREGGPFTSLDDFCRRVDLRQVNRRVLESLIRGGALDSFGERAQLLAVVDRMLSVSTSAHSASEQGQLSFFGGAIQTDTFGDLPQELPMPNKERLANEKELVGVYFSETPLTRIARTAKQLTSAYTSDLNEEMGGVPVTLGGMVISSRIITTKKGDSMSFVQFEDPQGSVELTLFPRTHAAFGGLVRPEAVLLVEGKVQVREGKVNILVDAVREYPVVEAEQAETGQLAFEPPSQPGRGRMVPGAKGQEARPDSGSAYRQSPVVNSAAQFTRVAAAQDMTMPTTSFELDPFQADESAPWDMMQDPFADDDVALPAPPEAASRPVAVARPAAELVPAVTTAPAPLPPLNMNGGINIPSKVAGVISPTAASGKQGRPTGSARPADPRTGPSATRSGEPSRRLHIHIQRTNNNEEDVRRLRGLLKLLTSSQGADHFCFYIPNSAGVAQLDFPNHTTNLAQIEPALVEYASDWARIQVEG